MNISNMTNKQRWISISGIYLLAGILSVGISLIIPNGELKPALCFLAGLPIGLVASVFALIVLDA